MCRVCGSMELMKKLNIKEEELKPVPQRKVGSACVAEELTIVGETAHPVTLSLGGTKKKFSLHLVFLRELDHLLNLGSHFLKAIGAVWNFKSDNLDFGDHALPLLDDQGRPNPTWNSGSQENVAEPKVRNMRIPREEAPDRSQDFGPLGEAVLAKDHILQPGRPAVLQLRVLDSKHHLVTGQPLIIEGHVGGAKCLFQPNRQVLPAVRALAEADEHGKAYSEALNLGSRTVKLRKGTSFGLAYQAEHVYKPEIFEKSTPGVRRVGAPEAGRNITLSENRGPKENASNPPPGAQPLDLETLSQEQYQQMLRQIREQLKLEESPFCQKDPKIKEQLLRILLRYYEAFSWDGSPGSTTLVEHEIITKPGLPPIREPYR